jgi:hypothetical protein
VAGLGLGAVFALAGGLAGFGLSTLSGSRTLSEQLTITASFGALGTLCGVPLGVTLVGSARGGRGGYGWSLLGTFAGGGLGGLLAAGMTSLEGAGAGTEALASVVVMATTVTGAVLGYELSNDQDRNPPRSSRGVSLQVGPLAGGVHLGLAGTL